MGYASAPNAFERSHEGHLAVFAVIGFLAVAALRSPLRAQQTPSAEQTPTQPTAPAQHPEPSTEPTPATVWEGAFTEEQVTRGSRVYVQQCSNCHGPELEGADTSPPLAGPAFTANWNDLSVGDLFERIRISMPQDEPGKLTRAQNADVIAFLLSANKFRAGKTELARELPLLKQIKILAAKP